MEPGMLLLISIFSLLALLVGILIGIRHERSKFAKSKTQGTIYADRGDSENSPSLFLESDVPVEDIISRDKVTFNVVVMSSDSRK